MTSGHCLWREKEDNGIMNKSDLPCQRIAKLDQWLAEQRAARAAIQPPNIPDWPGWWQCQFCYEWNPPESKACAHDEHMGLFGDRD